MPRLTIQQAIVEAIKEEMIRDETVFHLGQDIGVDFGGVMSSCKGLGELFQSSGRIINTPISEMGSVAMSVGAAMFGTRPIIQIMFGEFLSLVMCPLACDGATIHYRSGGKASVPLVVRALYGTGPHRGHAEDFHPWLTSVPGLKVVVPSNPYDAKGLMKAAIRDNNPVVVLEHMGIYHGPRGEVPEQDYVVPIGKASIVCEGKDVTVVSSGLMLTKAMRVAKKCVKDGLNIELIDLRSFAPLDVDTVAESVRKTGRLVVVSEGWKTGDITTELVCGVKEKLVGVRNVEFERVNTKDIPRPFPLPLESMVLPDEELIKSAVIRVLSR